MSYNTFLDTYFSSRWIGYGVPLVLMLILISFAKQIYRQKEYTLWMRAINIGIPFLLAIMSALINPMYWGYGNPQAIDDIRMMNGKLIVEDHIMTYGSRYSSGDAYSRIHVVNPETGDKTIRFSVGNSADLVGIHGDSICVSRYNDVAYFSIENGNCFAVYNKETLPKLYPELSAGIKNYMWGDGRKIMEISALDGTNWNLYTINRKIVSTDKKNKQRKEYKATNKLFIHDNHIRIDNQPGARDWLKLYGENGNQNKLFISNAHDSILNEDLFFLEGKITGLNIKDSCFFILHYETLKKEHFKISCISLDGKTKLWEIKQTAFNPDFLYPEDYSPQVYFDSQSQKLFFSIDTEILALNARDGKLLWRMKM